MKKQTRSVCRLALFAIVALPVPDAGASGFFDPEVRFTNLTVVARDAKTATIRFDVSWEGSWRHEINHDAAWVFFKVRADGKSEWQHVRLAADRVLDPTGYGQKGNAAPPSKGRSAIPYFQGRSGSRRMGELESSPDIFGRTTRDRGDTPLEILVPDGEDGFTGMFLRRTANGAGTVKARGVTAVWDLTADPGITDIGKAQVRAFGLEMVYVAGGPFYLGTSGPEVNAFYMVTDDPRRTPPFRVTSAGAIPTGRQAGKLWAQKDAQPEDGGEVPACFPKGYKPFYCMMKHITPRRYAEFLRTLTPEQADARLDTTISQVVRSGKPPDYTYTWHPGGARSGPGCWKLSWADGAAHAAWAGLRPMTELEIEKAIRGPREPIPDECGPSYWGISAFNFWQWDSIKGWDLPSERAVTVGNAAGRRFAGTHGRGTLTLPADWPQDDAVGAGTRCAGHLGLDRARVSDRLNAALASTERKYKWRGVRTAPREK